jgi:hypothetical protein
VLGAWKDPHGGLATKEQEAAAILTKTQEDFEAEELRAAVGYKNSQKMQWTMQNFTAGRVML